MNKTISVFALCFVILFLAFIGTYSSFSSSYAGSDYQETFSYLESGFARVNPPKVYNKEEAGHMRGVRLRFTLLNILFIASMTVVLASAKNHVFLKVLKNSALSLLILLACLAVMNALLSFDASWTIFHKVFFPEGNWLFSADSTIISLFPGEFFESFIKEMFLVVGFSSIVILFISYSQSILKRRR